MIAVATHMDLSTGEDLVNAKKNDSQAYLLAMGWLAERYRKDAELTLDQMGEKLGITGSGYRKMEQGSSPNLHRWCDVFEELGKDIVAVMSLARIFVRALQIEQDEQGRALTRRESEKVFSDLFSGLD